MITFKYSIYLLMELTIKKLRLDFASTISLEDYEMFLEIDSLEEIDCYYMPKFIVDKFNNKGVDVKLYNREKVSDRFMLMQDAFDYDTLYYKKNIEIIKTDSVQSMRDHICILFLDNWKRFQSFPQLKRSERRSLYGRQIC